LCKSGASFVRQNLNEISLPQNLEVWKYSVPPAQVYTTKDQAGDVVRLAELGLYTGIFFSLQDTAPISRLKL
jgi:hypothetical protein